jgi:response regulator NasT
MKILIADDESLIRMGLKSMLRGMGHSVVEASNGRDAVQIAMHNEPDLAILDIHMPYMDGLHAARAIHKIRPIPVIILTAFGQDEIIEKAAQFPIHGYLVKPIETHDLKAAIAIATHRFKEAQALATEKARLERQLETRKLVDRAKGKLMQGGLSEDEAYRAIQRHSREKRISMTAAAQSVLDWDTWD